MKARAGRAPAADTAARTWQLELPVVGNPHRVLLTANERAAWQRRWERTRYWRVLSTTTARSAINRGLLPRLQRAHVMVTIHWPDKRRRDVGNWAPTAKAIVDGLVDAGLIPDDRDEHLVGPDLRRGTGTARITLTITDLAPLEAP